MRVASALLVAGLGGVAAGLVACDRLPGFSLSKGDEIPLDAPRLGALAEATPVFGSPRREGPPIGYLHAGVTVPRAAKPTSTEGCSGGWYRIRPRGFVCVGETATLELSHPTLKAMSLAPEREAALPFPYGQATRATSFYVRDEAHPERVVRGKKLRAGSGVALIASWAAADEEGQQRRFGMTPAGQFVPVEDVRRAEPAEGTGVELTKALALPLGFVVGRHARAWRVEQSGAVESAARTYHEVVPLVGTAESVGDDELWATADGVSLRRRDLRVVTPRSGIPDWASKKLHWVDVDTKEGTVTLYEGERAVFTALATVGEETPAQRENATRWGEFEIAEKHLTLPTLDPASSALAFEVTDVPWVLRLSSGQYLYGAYWHDDFGRATSGGSIELAPRDAARVWAWVTPALPSGWHGVLSADGEEPRSRVVVR